jgi:hypothetical protein
MSADTATLTLSARYPAGAGGTIYTKVFSLSKAKGGYEIVSTIPTTNLFNGRVVYLTATDGTYSPNKLYRYVSGTGWTASVSAPDISGEISETQIGTNAITAPKIKAGEITSGKLYAGAVEADRIQTNNLAAGSITAAKVGTNEIIAFTANIKDGVIATAKIGDLQVDSAKIANLTVGTEKITGQAVTTSNIVTTTSDVSATADNTYYTIATIGVNKSLGYESLLKFEFNIQWYSSDDIRGSLYLESAGTTTGIIYGGKGGPTYGTVPIVSRIWTMYINGAGGTMYIPLSFVTTGDNVPSGTDTYTVKFMKQSGASTVTAKAGSTLAIREEKK